MTVPPSIRAATGSPTSDSGRPDEGLAGALARYGEEGAENPVLCLLADARLLVPVVAAAPPATGGSEAASTEKDTAISAVLMRGRDGRLALLAFTSVESMQRWDRAARPVPITGGDAARAATAQGARALLVDLAGPVPFVVETAELAELAAGHRLRETSVGYAWFL